MADRKALIVWGGWEGHQPQPCAEVMAELLGGDGFDVEVRDTLDAFANEPLMQSLSLVVPIWTMGTLSKPQEAGLLAAVRAGVGIAGFHGGMGDAFRGSTNYQWMVGGQWVAHPENIIDYTVQIVDRDHEITAGLGDFAVRSEQYYMHVDPSNHVLATTTFRQASTPWIQGCVMPVAWTRRFGQGRVFYSSLGHAAAEFDVPQVRQFQRRGMRWAAR